MILEVIMLKYVFRKTFKQLPLQHGGSVIVHSFCNPNACQLNEVRGCLRNFLLGDNFKHGKVANIKIVQRTAFSQIHPYNILLPSYITMLLLLVTSVYIFQELGYSPK